MWAIDDLDLLASDLDCSLTGLGGTQSSAFDMSDTLSAIQVIKFNNENDNEVKQQQHCLTFSGSFHQCLNKEKAKSAQDLSVHSFSSSYSFSRQETHKMTKKPCWKHHDDSYLEDFRSNNEADFVKPMTLPSFQAPVLSGPLLNHTLDPILADRNFKAEFQYILAASTALGSKIEEETLTYLNQGQSYEIRLRKLHGISEMKGKLLKSVLKVAFRDRRLQFREKLEIIAWQNQRPSERILDIDLSLSYGIFDVIPDQKSINCAEFMWDPTREASVFLKVNCISTEFTSKRRGGEKGVPFCIFIETYSHWENPPQILDAASCLIKVFKSKGADRKHKTDREKFDKLPLSEQRCLQPSYQYTLFTPSFLKGEKKLFHDYSNSVSPSSLDSIDTKPDSPVISTAEVSTSTPSITSSPQNALETKDNIEEVYFINQDMDYFSSSHIPTDDERLDISMNSDQVCEWLKKKKLTKYLQYFSSYSGKELLCLSREDLIEICGPPDGIRLFNCFQIKEPPPLRKFYISRDKIAFHAIYLHSMKLIELKEELCPILSLSLNNLGSVYVSGPDGILLTITDKVLKNMKDEAIFNCEVLKDEENEIYTVILKSYKTASSPSL